MQYYVNGSWIDDTGKVPYIPSLHLLLTNPCFFFTETRALSNATLYSRRVSDDVRFRMKARSIPKATKMKIPTEVCITLFRLRKEK